MLYKSGPTLTDKTVTTVNSFLNNRTHIERQNSDYRQ